MLAMLSYGQIAVFALIYFAAISFTAVAVTCYDKYAAKKRPRSRVSEKTLLLISAFGGSVAMYITMLAIRHKTQHKKFMIGIPVIIASQLVLLYACAGLKQ